jgi:hypothetical protein
VASVDGAVEAQQVVLGQAEVGSPPNNRKTMTQIHAYQVTLLYPRNTLFCLIYEPVKPNILPCFYLGSLFTKSASFGCPFPSKGHSFNSSAPKVDHNRMRSSSATASPRTSL